GVCGEGHELRVGRGAGGWSPEQLLLLGAESSLMESILAAARDADIQVLGYVSSAHLDVPDKPGAAPRLTLKPCIVVASVDDRQRARLMSASVARTSLAGRLLGTRLHVRLDVRLEPTARGPAAVPRLKKLTEYYSDPWVRRRIGEYCGAATSQPTCVYLSALNGDHAACERPPRLPVDGLEKLLADGVDVARSMWDRS